jgi:peptidoglycan LD-endopeptidase CwlK
MSRSLDDLSPLVRPMVDAFLAAAQAAGLDLLVTCTLRSMEDQAALYAQGRTAPGPIVTDAQAGQSAHNYGMAIDIVPIVNGKPDWQGKDPVWKQAAQLGQAAGLEWAGKWVNFPESPHFELPNWKTQITVA